MSNNNELTQKVKKRSPRETEMPGETLEKAAFPMAGKDTIGWVSPSYIHSTSVRLNPKVIAHNRCVAFFPNLPEVECYRVLRAQILPRTLDKGGNTLMLTSALPGEGKTLLYAAPVPPEPGN